MAKFQQPYLLRRSGLCRPIFFEIGNGNRPALVIRNLMQHSSQALLVLFSMRNAAIFLAAKELEWSEFFTAIQTMHGI